ncbi:MbtH family protein [Streptomyces lydicus]|uniref:MbtH family protein n=1 Tax=Streptomyces lydicus TaxID=47763 RepID=UPI0036F7F231
MTNPFEDVDGTYLVLTNGDNQHSLWPARLAPPMGWTVAHGATGYQACLDYVDAHWTDLTPKPALGH